MITYTIEQLDAWLDLWQGGMTTPYEGGHANLVKQLRDALAKNEIDKITMDNFLKRIAKLEATIKRVKAERDDARQSLIITHRVMTAEQYDECRKRKQALQQEQDNDT